MRSLRIRNPATAPADEAPLDVWLEPNGASQVNIWVGNSKGKQAIARVQLRNEGDIHLRLPVLVDHLTEALGISSEPNPYSLAAYPRHHTAVNIAVNKE